MKLVIRGLTRAIVGLAVCCLGAAAAPEARAQAVVEKDVEELTAVAPFGCDEAHNQFVIDEDEDSCGGISTMGGPGWADYLWPGAVENSYHYITNYGTPQDGSEYATWSPTITVAGQYEVWVDYRASENRSSSAPFYVYSDDGTTYKIIVNQMAGVDNALNYAKLGTFFFDVHEASAYPMSGYVKATNEEGHSECIDGAYFKLVSAGGSSSDVPAPADYDGDGKTDFAVFHTADGTWDVGYTGGGYVVAYPFAPSGSVPVPGDYDGDGKADGAAFDQANGAWYLEYSGGQAPVLGYVFGSSETTPVAGDYDGDGKADLALFWPDWGAWYIAYSSGKSPLIGYVFGLDGTTPVPGDYDGDGKADLALYWAQWGAWYVAYSSGQSPLVGYTLGNSETTPVPGDYDGDGKADMALFWPDWGAWYIAYSSGKSPLLGYVFGSSETTPAPGDYDGDGKTDLALYHAASQTWYVAYSNGGTLEGYKIGAVGDARAAR